MINAVLLDISDAQFNNFLKVIGSVALFFLIITVLFISTIKFFYVLTLYKILIRISPENRMIPPKSVWILFIPIFGTLWRFVVVGKLADSLSGEFIKRNIKANESRPGFAIGIAYCILVCLSMLPLTGLLKLKAAIFFVVVFIIAAFICWIIYWIKIANYMTKLPSTVLPNTS